MTTDQDRGAEFDRLYQVAFAASKDPAAPSLTSMVRRMFDQGVRVTPLLPETVRPALVEMPIRIQLSRRRGWRLPDGAVSVARPGRWGNPFIVGTAENGGNISPTKAVQSFRAALLEDRLAIRVPDVKRELRGRMLACWCHPNSPCHADVLLEVANP